MDESKLAPNLLDALKAVESQAVGEPQAPIPVIIRYRADAIRSRRRHR